MACELALLMTASGSLDHNKIFFEISLKSTASCAILLTFATKHGLLKIMHIHRLLILYNCWPHLELHSISPIYSWKILYGSYGNTFQNEEFKALSAKTAR